MENAELLRKLRELTIPRNTPPEGWFTVDQWAEKWGIARRTAGRYLLAGVKSGMMEKGMYRPENGRQVMPHFRPRESGGSVGATGSARTSGK